MKLTFTVVAVAVLGIASQAGAQQQQQSPPTQQQSAPKQHNQKSSQSQKQSSQKPSSQESAPPPTKTAPPSANPEDPHTSTTGAADKKTFQAGKKPDDSAGCSTPTDAKSAGVDTSKDSAIHKRSNGQRTVCTTAGAEGVGAIEKPKKKPSPKKPDEAPDSTSANPR